MNAFFNCQFNYCPVIWIFHNQALNNKINRLHERCLHIVYNDKTSTFNELLEKDNSVSVYYRNIQALAIEMFIVANGMPPAIINELFQLREQSHYNLRYTSNLSSHLFIVFTMVVSYVIFEPKIWELIPPVIRQIDPAGMRCL